jgi:hypothetical protein
MARFEFRSPGRMSAEAQFFPTNDQRSAFSLLRIRGQAEQVTIYLPADHADYAQAIAAAINAPVAQAAQVPA